MNSALLGVFAAFAWSLHDLVARSFAARLGPARLAIYVMLMGFLLLSVWFGWFGFPALKQADMMISLLLGLSFGLGAGGLFRAFSLGPISLVGPLTSSYPALVVIWGMLHGFWPTGIEWAAIAATFSGALIVARASGEEHAHQRVAPGKFPELLVACVLCSIGYAASVVIGQEAAVQFGEVESTWISRLSAAALLLPLAFRERPTGRASLSGWWGVLAMAVCDVLSVIAISSSGHLPDKELAAIGISAYGGIAVILAAIVLKERVRPLQWGGIALIVGGVSVLASAG